MTSSLSKKSFILMTLFLVTCEMYEFVDFDDILSPTWMPGTLLEQVSSNGDTASNHSRSSSTYFSIGRALDGTINNALDTMKFHRFMINQYLCRSYVANQILSEVTRNSFKRRMSDLDQETSENSLVQRGKFKSGIILDQGSSSYQDWLMKSSTLEDIYHNHNRVDKVTDADVPSTNAEIEKMDHAFQTSTKLDSEYDGVRDMSDSLIYDGGQYAHELPTYFAHPSSHPATHIHNGYRKGDKLADLFEIALTALAYLSFGMFIVHLIMSICAISNNQTSTINTRIVGLNIRPAAINADPFNLELDSTVTESIFGSEEEKYRSHKIPTKSTRTENFTLNELAKQFLNVFDSALMAHKDEGQCLRKSLCNATRYSRYVNGKSKFFMALWWSLLSLTDLSLSDGQILPVKWQLLRTNERRIAMGSPLIPVTFSMEDFGKKAIDSSSYKPSIWFRYVDDTFVVWKHGRNRLGQFLDHKALVLWQIYCFGVSWLSERLSSKVVSKTESLEAILFGLGMANCDTIYKKCLPKPL